jgi:hypothetical protein
MSRRDAALQEPRFLAAPAQLRGSVAADLEAADGVTAIGLSRGSVRQIGFQ